ncbi:MAG: PadR family transcriptional regulator [Promethearchaeota archaeon]
MFLEERLDNELKSNLQGYLILKCVEHYNGVSYGYQIKQYIEQKIGEKVSEGTLYPLLSKMTNPNKYGYLSSFQEETEKKRKRRYYKLTIEGRNQLSSWPEAWKRVRDFVQSILLQIGAFSDSDLN